MDNVPVEKVREFEAGLYKYADLSDKTLQLIEEKKELNEEIEAEIKKLLDDYKATVDYLVK
jgi:F0F1-type ATP synthase alpha subunit